MSLSGAATMPTTATLVGAQAGLAEPQGDLEFPDGLPGFVAHRHFRLQPEPACGGRFMRLQSADDPALSFVVLPVEPGPATPSPADLAEVSAERRIAERDLVVLLMVAIRPAGKAWEMSVNMRAPVFVDSRRRQAWQVVLRDPAYPVRVPLVPTA